MLFGHQDDASKSSAPATVPGFSTPQDPSVTGANPLALDPATGVSFPVVPAGSVPVDNAQDEPSVLDQPSAPSYDSATAFANDPAPTSPFSSSQAPAILTSPEPVQQPTNATPSEVAVSINNNPVASDPVDPSQLSNEQTVSDDSMADDLLDIKQQALSQLGPLVSHLDQAPEEKFRTTMMLIQTTDNSALLKDAYAAAQAISDDTLRAQALLDVVNEINYFTQQAPANDQ